VSGIAFLRRVRAFLIGKPPPVDATPEHTQSLPVLKLGPDHAADVGRLLERLDAQGSSPFVMAGCVMVLGLDAVEARLGPRWEVVADKAVLIAQEVLDQHLSGGDIYRQVGEATFQICFETNDESYARFQVNRISAAIESALKRVGAGEELSVDTFVAPVRSERIRGAKDPLSVLYSNLLEIREAVNARSVRQHSIPALRYAGALFQPLWSNRDFGRTKNRCVLDTLAGAAAAKHLEEIQELDDLVEALANIDCVIFAKSIEGLHHALSDVKRATIVIPVHFQTLVTQQQDYMELAQTLPLQYRRFVLLDVIGVPTAATTREMLRAAQTGRTITDRIVLQLSPSDHRLNDKIKTLLWGVSISLNELDIEDSQIARDLARFALLASEDGLYSFSYGANTIAKAASVVEAGFDYVGGSAVHNTVPVPRPHTRFTAYFGDPISRSNGLDRKGGVRAHPRFAPLDPNSTITLLDGEQHSCRISNVSASGAVILSSINFDVGAYLAVGSLPAQVVRISKGGFAVRFLEVQRPSVVEIALQTPLEDEQLLTNLRALSV
jgi:hypothetical protein